MSKHSQAIVPSSWIERLLLLAFLGGSLWAGKYLAEFLRHGQWVPQAVEKPSAPLRSEWNEAHLFERIPSMAHEAQYQLALNRKLSEVLGRTVSLHYIFRVMPPILNGLNSFEDYSVLPASPLPGSVFRLSEGPRCLEFSWSEIPLPDVRYTLEIAKTRDFAFFRSFGSDTNWVRVQASRKSDFFWRVRATHNRQVSFSPLSSFMVLEPRLTPEQKRLRALASRVRDPSAWLTDLDLCQ